MRKNIEPWIGVDLDGTLAYNEEGVYKGGTHIGEPIPKMVERVKKWIADGKTVKIFTARNDRRQDEPETIKAIEDWCLKHLGKVLEITNVKDNQCKQIWDDRAYGVIRNTGEMRPVSND